MFAAADPNEHVGNDPCDGRVITVPQKILVSSKTYVPSTGHALQKAYIGRAGRMWEFQMQPGIGCQLDRIGDVSVALFLEIQTFKHMVQ